MLKIPILNSLPFESVNWGILYRRRDGQPYMEYAMDMLIFHMECEENRVNGPGY